MLVAPVQELVEIVDSPNVIRVEVSAHCGVVGSQQHLDVEREDGVHLRFGVVPGEQMRQAQTSGAAVCVLVRAGDRVALEARIRHSSCGVAALERRPFRCMGLCCLGEECIRSG